jgi:hypothetical protein
MPATKRSPEEQIEFRRAEEKALADGVASRDAGEVVRQKTLTEKAAAAAKSMLIKTRIIRNDAPSEPLRKMPAPIIQDWPTAQRALAILREAAKAASDEVNADPEAHAAQFLPSPAATKTFIARWQQDIRQCILDAVDGRPLSLIDDGHWGRAHRALRGLDAHEPNGALAIQEKITRELEEDTVRDNWQMHADNLHKMDLAIAETLVSLRHKWNARIAAAEKVKRPQGVPPYPQIRWVGEHVSRLIKQIGNNRPDDLV